MWCHSVIIGHCFSGWWWNRESICCCFAFVFSPAFVWMTGVSQVLSMLKHFQEKRWRMECNVEREEECHSHCHSNNNTNDHFLFPLLFFLLHSKSDRKDRKGDTHSQFPTFSITFDHISYGVSRFFLIFTSLKLPSSSLMTPRSLTIG
jgi:hypothetical protein